MDKNMVREVTDKQRATSEEMVKMLNAGSPLSNGAPVPSFNPPGTVVAEA